MNDTTIENNDTCTTETCCRTAQTVYRPAVDVLENEQEWALRANVPGARPENIDIDYERGQLTIRAHVEPRQDNVRYALHEYGVGDFVRTFRVGEDIDPESIVADVRDGVLTVHLPKRETAKVRKIAVQSA